MKNKIAVPIATWFGCGYAPKAPGTVGSAAGVAVAWVLAEYAGFTPLWFAALAAVSAPAAMWASGATARYLKTKDPGVVVVDEVVGQWMAFAGAGALNWKTYLAGFVLFRLFDIVKPPPVRQLEKLPGGVGIVADDVGAGVYAALVLFLAQCFNL